MSKKYKVLKDFPRAKSGDILELVEKEHGNFDSVNCGYLQNKREWSTELVITSHLIEDAIQDGFIEEIKESSRWRADYKERYYYINDEGTTAYEREFGTVVDGKSHDLGNYFRSEETATKVSEALKLFFEYLHTPFGFAQLDIHDKFLERLLEARMSVLTDD